jgi:hypothetical protein
VSDQEGFLKRWSRRKREGEQDTSAETPAAAAANAPTAPAACNETDAASNALPAEEQPHSAVDLASLPPLESITAGSDIRAFLAPGIPAHLTRAALRRAWVADPAIRDFVGLAENAWDFNAPDAIPGFGSVLPAQEAQRLLAEVMRNDDRVSSPADESESTQKPDVSACDQKPSAPAVEEASVADAPDHRLAKQQDADAAVQKEEAADDRPVRSARHHGGALPH